MVTISVSEQSVPTLARLMTLTTLELHGHMLGLYVLIQSVDGGDEATLNALPPLPFQVFSHPGSDRGVGG